MRHLAICIHNFQDSHCSVEFSVENIHRSFDIFMKCAVLVSTQPKPEQNILSKMYIIAHILTWIPFCLHMRGLERSAIPIVANIYGIPIPPETHTPIPYEHYSTELTNFAIVDEIKQCIRKAIIYELRIYPTQKITAPLPIRRAPDCQSATVHRLSRQ